MAQMDLATFNGGSNTDILDAIRGTMDPVYQSRVPDATRAGLDAVMNGMANYTPAMNQFMDALVNLIGAQIVRYNSWTNPLAVYKQGLLSSGESVEEVALGLLKAKVYKPEADPTLAELFGQEKPDVQTVFHKVNRQEWYKVSVNESQLERAFLNPNGLSEFISGMMASINTSDNVDEFVETASTLRRYYDAGGFFKLAVPNINSISATPTDAKQYLKQVRGMSDTLPFISRAYNARHMPMRTDPADLMLLMTPTAKATIDVEGLSAAFQIDKAQINSRITVIPDEYVNIPGFQGILTTKRFWILADKLMRMGTIQNPVGLYNNYIWHHQEIISASPFENAILLTSAESQSITVRQYQIGGLSNYNLIDLTTGQTVTVANGSGATPSTATVIRGRNYLVQITAYTDPVGGPLDSVTLRLRGNTRNTTHLNQYGYLTVGIDDEATTLTVNGKATDDRSYTSDLALAVTGTVIYGSVGLAIDDNPTILENTRKPGITPATGGPVGTALAVTHGSWDTPDLQFAYQWKRNGTAISGATVQDYTTVTADGGTTITCTITASKTGYTSGAATANGVNITAS